VDHHRQQARRWPQEQNSGSSSATVADPGSMAIGKALAFTGPTLFDLGFFPALPPFTPHAQGLHLGLWRLRQRLRVLLHHLARPI
jgi:hypothetical protein